MKESKKTKLSLNKTTVQDFPTLDMNEQQAVKGGTGNTGEGITNRPIYC